MNASAFFRRPSSLLFCSAFLAACQDAPTAPDLQPQFLLGDSPLAPITLDNSGTLPVLLAPVTVNKGIARVAIEDKFLLRATGEFQLPDGTRLAAIGPDEIGLIGQKDADARQGSDVGFIMDMDIPAPTWDRIRSLDEVRVQLLVHLLLSTASGTEKVLDSVKLDGSIYQNDGR